MKRLTTLLLTTALTFQGAIALAQIDEAKMERDLRVASSVLASLLKNDTEDIFSNGEPEGNFVEGYGVVFTVEDQGSVFRLDYVENKEAQREMQKAYREASRQHKEAVKSNNLKGKVATESFGTFKISGSEKEIEELVEKSEIDDKEFGKKLRNAFEIFLIEYSQLISQLKPDDKILLSTTKGSAFNLVFVGEKRGNIEDKKTSRLSAEMLVKDHKNFQNGKISREKLLAKIKFEENEEIERKPDLDLFSNMLKTTYDSKYTETYFMSSIPKYEVLAGLGVVYSVKVYSSYQEGAFFRMPTLNQTGMSEEERNKAVEEMYPQFVEDFKENIIRYGSTIKSLEASEKLIIKIKMTKCGICTFPSTIEFMVEKSVLDQFSKGSLNLAQAKGKVKFK